MADNLRGRATFDSFSIHNVTPGNTLILCIHIVGMWPVYSVDTRSKLLNNTVNLEIFIVIVNVSYEINLTKTHMRVNVYKVVPTRICHTRFHYTKYSRSTIVQCLCNTTVTVLTRY